MSINAALFNGLAGMNSFSTALSVVSDNVANANTTGFKANTPLFSDLVSGFFTGMLGDTEMAGAGSRATSVLSNLNQGSIGDGTRWSDLAIQGDGFFAVQDSAGETFYTRDGSFKLDNQGYLATNSGNRVLDTGGNPIQVMQNLPTIDISNLSVSNDGTISYTDATGQPQTMASQIGITTFRDPNALLRRGNNMFSPLDPADAQVGTANDGIRGAIMGSSLESSNVDLAKEMVNMIIYQASYNANSKSISTSKDMIDTTIGMVR